MFGPLVTALRTLTVLPVPGKEGGTLSGSLPFFPVVGAFIGIILYLSGYALSHVFTDNPLLCGGLVAGISAVVTGALHLDGLADVADGFGGGHTRERILEIMKDSRHGTFGVTAIIFDCIGKTLFFGWCMSHDHIEMILMSVVFSRTVQAWGCVILPYARISEGGTASPFFEGKNPSALILSTIGITGGVIVFFGILPMGMVALMSLIPIQIFFMVCLKKINGITGDCLGAANEICELSVLMSGCAAFTLSAGI